jgi:integrase
MESMVIFAIETAMRLGEIINLSWSEIDYERKIATLLVTKNGDVRQVPLSTLAIQSIKNLPRHIERSRVFWRWETVSGFESSWQRVLSNSNLLNFRFHDLRHEATSRMFEKGFSLAEVATISGHKTWSMLRRYTHLKAEDLVKKLA